MAPPTPPGFDLIRIEDGRETLLRADPGRCNMRGEEIVRLGKYGRGPETPPMTLLRLSSDLRAAGEGLLRRRG